METAIALVMALEMEMAHLALIKITHSLKQIS
jgi:hypothetical protein